MLWTFPACLTSWPRTHLFLAKKWLSQFWILSFSIILVTLPVFYASCKLAAGSRDSITCRVSPSGWILGLVFFHLVALSVRSGWRSLSVRPLIGSCKCQHAQRILSFSVASRKETFMKRCVPSFTLCYSAVQFTQEGGFMPDFSPPFVNFQGNELVLYHPPKETSAFLFNIIINSRI